MDFALVTVLLQNTLSKILNAGDAWETATPVLLFPLQTVYLANMGPKCSMENVILLAQFHIMQHRMNVFLVNPNVSIALLIDVCSARKDTIFMKIIAFNWVTF